MSFESPTFHEVPEGELPDDFSAPSPENVLPEEFAPNYDADELRRALEEVRKKL